MQAGCRVHPVTLDSWAAMVRLKLERAVDAGSSGRRPLLLPFPAHSARAFGLSDATSEARVSVA